MSAWGWIHRIWKVGQIWTAVSKMSSVCCGVWGQLKVGEVTSWRCSRRWMQLWPLLIFTYIKDGSTSHWRWWSRNWVRKTLIWFSQHAYKYWNLPILCQSQKLEILEARELCLFVFVYSVQETGVPFSNLWIPPKNNIIVFVNKLLLKTNNFA